MVKLFLYGVSSLLAYIGGFFAYTLTLKVVWQQTLSSGDMEAVLYWGGIAFLLLAVPIYLLIMNLIDKRIEKWRVLFYPLGCMLVFFIPTLLITLSFGSMNPFSPEAMLFHSFFLSSGLIFGLCSWGIRMSQ